MTMYKEMTPKQLALQTQIQQQKVRDKQRRDKIKEVSPWSNYLRSAKSRAQKKNVPFNITAADVEAVWTDICPILGIPLVQLPGQASDNSPSLDRIIPEKGYVKGNIRIISNRANTIKSYGTLEEHRAVVKYMEDHIKKVR